MKIITRSLILLLFLPPLAFAECVALEYQEMKDMPADELRAEYCKAHNEAARYYRSGLDDGLRGRVGTENAQQISERCVGQRDRIGRVLKQKGGDVGPALNAQCTADGKTQR